MPKRQGRDDFGLNFQTRKLHSRKIQTNFNIVIFIELAANRLRPSNLAIWRNEKLPRYRGLELRSRLCELGLRHSPVVILVEFCNLRGVLDRQRQCRLKAVRLLADR